MGIKIVKMIKSVFVKPEKKLSALKPEIKQLRSTLQEISKSQDSLTGIVRFFNTVSEWHDRGINDLIVAFESVNYGQYDRMLNELRILQEHFESAGRSQFGWNRTKQGETVTENNVFLGNIYGLLTKPVSFWKEKREEEYAFGIDIVSKQAKEFMDSHTGPMIIILKNLEIAA